MTDAAAYPRCKHGRAIYERCAECEADMKAGKHGGFERAAPSSKTMTFADEVVWMTKGMDLRYDRSIEESMLLDIALKAQIAQKLQDETKAEPVFDDLIRTLSSQLDKIQHLKNMLGLTHHLLKDRKQLTPEQDRMVCDAFAAGTIDRCSCGAHMWGPEYHRIIDSDLNSHYGDRRCDLPESSVKTKPAHLEPWTCPKCQQLNSAGSSTCGRCEDL